MILDRSVDPEGNNMFRQGAQQKASLLLLDLQASY